MNIKELLKRLKDLKIYVEEDRKSPEDGARVLIFRTHLPSFPFGDQQVWYPLQLDPGQIFVEREEIEALLRHLWHGSYVCLHATYEVACFYSR